MHGVDDDLTAFTAAVEARLYCLFVTQHGELGPEPELLLKQRVMYDEELAQTEARLAVHQNNRLVAMEHVHTPAPLNLRLGLGMALGCGLTGLLRSAAGFPMPWQAWAMLGGLAVGLTLLVQAWPRWAANGRYYRTLCALRRRVTSLQRTVKRLNTAAWKVMERRSQCEQFIAPRKQLLVNIFMYYQAAGTCTAQQPQSHRVGEA